MVSLNWGQISLSDIFTVGAGIWYMYTPLIELIVAIFGAGLVLFIAVKVIKGAWN